MSEEPKLVYKDTMKEARQLYKNLGIPLFLFLILFGLARDLVFVPLMSKIWGLALSTTPDGYVSNANVLNAIKSSPWILLIGAALIVFYAILVMWQASAIIIGIGYIREGKKINIRDLWKVSLQQLVGRVRKSNWMIVVYSLVIVPLANVYQTSDLVSRFVIPEYIQDFFYASPLLTVVFIAFGIFLVYIALRWFFLLPSFVLKKKDFKQAKEESNKLTEKCFIKNGVFAGLYAFGELIRLSILPMILLLVPVFICYLFTRGMTFSARLFHMIGISGGMELAKGITGTLVQVSAMCFVVELYFDRLSLLGMDTDTQLPPLSRQSDSRTSINTLQAIASVCCAVLIALLYLGTVFVAQTDSNIIYEIFGATEVIAHKGYSTKAPENTMPAFKLADECKDVLQIELDVRSTKDGVPVVIHNATIKDATGVDKAVYDCTYEELQALPATYAMDEKDFPDARIPSLEEVIATYASSTPLLIEIKGYKEDPELPAKIVELMKKYHCEYTSKIHSGDYGALEAVKKIDPDIQCGLILALVTGNYYDLPYADFFSVEHTFVSDSMISDLHKRGKKVYAWTVNYEESAEGLRFSGVDGLITDEPEKISTYVSDENELVQEVLFRDLTNLFRSEEGYNSYENGDY